MSNSTKSERNEKGVWREGPANFERARELLTLAIDSATSARSVAVLRGSETLALRRSPLKGPGASTLLKDIDVVLKEASLGLGDVELFAVANGPGSFTGLRSGIATVKAFGVAFKTPVLGVPTLHALARGVGRPGKFAAFIPAGRGEVFAQFLRVDERFEVWDEGPAMHLAPVRLIERAVEKGFEGEWVAGGGARCTSLTQHAKEAGRVLVGETDDGDGVSWKCVEGPDHLAESLAVLAQGRFARGVGYGPEHLKALYVRPSDAELNV